MSKRKKLGRERGERGLLLLYVHETANSLLAGLPQLITGPGRQTLELQLRKIGRQAATTISSWLALSLSCLNSASFPPSSFLSLRSSKRAAGGRRSSCHGEQQPAAAVAAAVGSSLSLHFPPKTRRARRRRRCFSSARRTYLPSFLSPSYFMAWHGQLDG
jgi:hypothetical protein